MQEWTNRRTYLDLVECRERRIHVGILAELNPSYPCVLLLGRRVAQSEVLVPAHPLESLFEKNRLVSFL
jgi:hypothetical protein